MVCVSRTMAPPTFPSAAKTGWEEQKD